MYLPTPTGSVATDDPPAETLGGEIELVQFTLITVTGSVAAEKICAAEI